MLNLPFLRWGQPYTSLEQDTVAHFLTGQTLAKVSQANTGLLGRDMRQARRAREVLTEIPIADLIEMMKNHFGLSNMDQILDALTRGLPLDVLTRGYGVESRGVTVSYQAQSPVL